MLRTDMAMPFQRLFSATERLPAAFWRIADATLPPRERFGVLLRWAAGYAKEWAISRIASNHGQRLPKCSSMRPACRTSRTAQ